MTGHTRIGGVLIASVFLAVSTTSALDLSFFVGTMEVVFQPMQSAGIKEGCTLVYRVVGQDWAYRNGNLISLAGNIAYHTNKDRSYLGLSLKIGTMDSLAPNAKLEPPFFAYLQTPHGTTARSKFVQADGEPGFLLFTHQLGGEILNVYEDILSGAPVTIGFNRKKDGLDVLIPLDLRVAESTIAADGSIKRRRSDEMLLQFLECVTDVTTQVQKQIGAQ